MPPGSVRVQYPFRSDRSGQPFLSPLGRRRALPAIALPLALTAVGGVALVVAFGMLFGLQSRQAARDVPEAASPASIGQPALAAARPAEEAASLTALPAPPPAPIPAAGPALLPAGAATPDPGSTAAIPRLLPAEPAAPEADVAVAETDDEIAALEEIQAEENRDDLGGNAQMRPATVTSAVNLRAGPDNDAEVVKVLPDGAEIEAEDGCRWCRVAHDGVSGYVYRNFIDYR